MDLVIYGAPVSIGGSQLLLDSGITLIGTGQVTNDIFQGRCSFGSTVFKFCNFSFTLDPGFAKTIDIGIDIFDKFLSDFTLMFLDIGLGKGMAASRALGTGLHHGTEIDLLVNMVKVSLALFAVIGKLLHLHGSLLDCIVPFLDDTFSLTLFGVQPVDFGHDTLGSGIQLPNLAVDAGQFLVLCLDGQRIVGIHRGSQFNIRLFKFGTVLLQRNYLGLCIMNVRDCRIDTRLGVEHGLQFHKTGLQCSEFGSKCTGLGLVLLDESTLLGNGRFHLGDVSLLLVFHVGDDFLELSDFILDTVAVAVGNFEIGLRRGQFLRILLLDAVVVQHDDGVGELTAVSGLHVNERQGFLGVLCDIVLEQDFIEPEDVVLEILLGKPGTLVLGNPLVAFLLLDGELHRVLRIDRALDEVFLGSGTLGTAELDGDFEYRLGVHSVPEFLALTASVGLAEKCKIKRLYESGLATSVGRAEPVQTVGEREFVHVVAV